MVRLRTSAAVCLILAFVSGCDSNPGPTGVKRLTAAGPSLNAGEGLVDACVGGQPTAIPPGRVRQQGLQPGDYFTTLIVDPTTTEPDARHFQRITDAIAAVRAGRIGRNEKTVAQAACRITISVEPGTYRGSFTADQSLELFPLVLDVPRVTLEGALRMKVKKGRSDGTHLPGVSTLEPVTALLGGTAPQAIIVVTDSSNGFHGDGINDTRGDSVTISGFAFESGNTASGDTPGAGSGIFALRAHGLIVQGNWFEGPLSNALDARATTALVTLNSVQNLGTASCALCLGGPGDFEVTGNFVVRSGTVGIFFTAVNAPSLPAPAGIRPYPLPSSSSVAAVTGTVWNNLVQDEVQEPVGTALRISAIGSGAASVPQRSTVSVLDNDMVHNRFGMIFDAGFPGPKNLSPSSPTANLDVTLGGNTFAASCEVNLLVGFARHTMDLGLPTPAGNAGYIKQSHYVISLGADLAWNSVWFSHPAVDNTITLNNTLTVDGAVIPNGGVSAYNATTPCVAAP